MDGEYLKQVVTTLADIKTKVGAMLAHLRSKDFASVRSDLLDMAPAVASIEEIVKEPQQVFDDIIRTAVSDVLKSLKTIISGAGSSLGLKVVVKSCCRDFAMHAHEKMTTLTQKAVVGSRGIKGSKDQSWKFNACPNAAIAILRAQFTKSLKGLDVEAVESAAKTLRTALI